jgi:hypothetical protein
MRRAAGLFIAAVMAVGCSSPSSQSKPSASLIASPASSSPRAAAATASPVPAPTPTAPAIAAKKLKVRWRADDPVGLDAVTSIIGVARAGDAYVLVAELPYRNEESASAAAWWSRDGRTWKLALEFPADQRILAVTAGGPGFVVAGFKDDGAVVFTSIDGREWQPVSDASLRQGVIHQLVATANGLVGFGSQRDSDAGAIFTSPDGSEWLAATNATGLRVAAGLEAVGAYDGRAVAFVSEGDDKPSAIWETTGRAEWTRIGSLPDQGAVDRVAGGARGWVALGANRAWTSSDGRSWSAGVAGPDVTADVVVDESGFIAVGWVGSLPGETCGDQREFAGHTWTSSDGQIWERMPVTAEFKSAMVTRLLIVDRTLIGYGGRIGDDPEGMTIGRWTAGLPAISRPADVSHKATVPRSCGG